MVLSLNGETWYGYAITVNTSTYYFYYCFEFVNLSKMFNIGLWTKKFYRKHVIEKEFFKTEELVGLHNRYELATVIIWVISLIAVLLFHVAIMVMIHLDECTFDPTNRRHKIIVTSSCNWMEKTNYANAIGMSLLGTLAVVARVATFIYLECYQKLILKEYSDGRRVYFTLSIIFTILITTGFGWTKLFTKIRELQIYGKDFECGIMRVLLSTFVFTLPSTLFLPVIAIVNLKIINFKQRLVIPIYWNGRIVSFQTRDITDRSGVKYIACPKYREIIHHKHILYVNPINWEIMKGGRGVVVEGVTDVWKLGDFSIATFGIKYKMEQVRILAKHLKEIVIIYDFENQAQQQADVLIKQLEFRGVQVAKEKIENDPGSLSYDDAKHLMKQIMTKIY